MIDEENEPIAVVFGYYDDWFRPDIAPHVITAVMGTDDWELEVVIAAEAVYASNFLSPN